VRLAQAEWAILLNVHYLTLCHQFPDMRCTSVLCTALLTIADGALMTPEEETKEIASLTDMEGFFRQMVEVYSDMRVAQVPLCKQVSAKWAEAKCNSATACASGDKTACCKHTENAKKCEDSSEDWRRSLGFKSDATGDVKDCCDACDTDDTTTDAYKGTCTKDFFGASVCGTKNDKAIPGPPIAWAESCSTGPTYDVDGTDDKDGVKSCRATQADLDYLIKAYKAGEMKSGFFTAPDYDKSDVKKYMDKASSSLFGFMRAVVTNAAGVTDKAYFTMSGWQGETDKPLSPSEQCLNSALEPHLNADMEATSGVAHVFNPTVTKDGTVALKNACDANVVGGNNAGTVKSTTTGKVRIHNLTNSGQVTVSNCKDGFVSSVVNSGKVTFSGVEGSAVDIVNTGTIIIDATSNIRIKFRSNTGTVTFEEGSKGSVEVPKGQNANVKTAAGVTMTETASLAAPSAGLTDGAMQSTWQAATCLALLVPALFL